MKLSSRFVVLTLLAILLAAGTLTLLTNQHVDAQTAARLAVEMLENNPTATAQSSQTESELLTAQETADTLEIFTWWSGAGELDALSALAALYESEHPTVSVVVSSDYSILTDRLIHGTPPDSFQTHIGQELVETWVKPGYLEPIDLLWQEEDWLDKFPSELINMASYQGQVYAVPIDIHRGNVLWCNKDIFATHGLTVPTTIQEFFTVASQLQAAGIVPLALGDKYSWPATHLFETVLLGVLGPEGYNDLWTGELGFTEPNVKQAIETFGQITDYVNPNHSALDWGDAGQLLIQGEAAMLIMGDWMDGYFRANGWQPDIDYCWAPSPDTSGSLTLISDAFTLPAGLTTSANALDWLSLVGSVHGQDTFNPLKGAAPARLDANPDLYGSYVRWSMTEMVSDTSVASIAHGVAAPPAFVGAANGVVADFIEHRNVDAAAEALQQAACDAGFCPPQEATEFIIADVEDLIDEGALIQGQGNSLIRKLDVAIAQMNRENTKAAINMLEAFVNHVHGLINEGVLAPAEGQTLIDAVNRVIDSVG